MTIKEKECAAAPSIFLPRMGRIVAAKMLTEKEKFFRVVLGDGKPLGHKPGQFVEVSLFGIGEAPISICSSPTQVDSFEMCVRAVGSVTNAMHRLEAGATLGLRGPYGNGFDMDAMKGSDMLFVAGGLGMAPSRGVIKYCLDRRNDFGKVTILYGAKNPKELLFTDDLAEWAARPDCEFHVTVDRPDDTWKGNRGVITTLFKLVKVNPSNTHTVIIGPPVMYKYAILEALSAGVPENRILCSLERRMKCGVGRCGHCQIGNVYVCKEGPVFSYAQIKRLREGI
jgi:sulfhydrogenase subunit gamma (sulfur reductase)